MNLKSLFFVLAMLTLFKTIYGQTTQQALAPCPKSPNCCHSATNRSPLLFDSTPEKALEKLYHQLEGYENAILIDSTQYYLHYTFETKIGNFIDDVEFLIDPKLKMIQYRSASRKGYGDFGKNKRRMKQIKNDWEKNN